MSGGQVLLSVTVITERDITYKLKSFCAFLFFKGFMVSYEKIISYLIKKDFVHGLGSLRTYSCIEIPY